MASQVSDMSVLLLREMQEFAGLFMDLTTERTESTEKIFKKLCGLSILSGENF